VRDSSRWTGVLTWRKGRKATLTPAYCDHALTQGAVRRGTHTLGSSALSAGLEEEEEGPEGPFLMLRGDERNTGMGMRALVRTARARSRERPCEGAVRVARDSRLGGREGTKASIRAGTPALGRWPTLTR
jgi:hypothetical protein